MASSIDRETEWLEADPFGGFASGTASGVRTRRYHALLMASATPPTGRFVLVNGFDAWLETPSGRTPLTTQHYAGEVDHPDGARSIRAFTIEPWPTWKYVLPDGTVLERELFVPRSVLLGVSAAQTQTTVLAWRLLEGAANVRLSVRLYFSGRDYHALHHENPSFGFTPDRRDDLLIWRPYPGVPSVTAWANGDYRHQPWWNRCFSYQQEQDRGLDHVEDLASPGEFIFQLSRQTPAVLVLTAGEPALGDILPSGSPLKLWEHWREAEASRRAALADPLCRGADAYIVTRGERKTIIAGYPWFTDWGRDTFISLRGLCLATERLADAQDILLAWSAMVSEGMLPNRFPDRDEELEYNSVDASLWYIVAAYEFLRQFQNQPLDDQVRRDILEAVQAILQGFSRGTRHGIRMDGDGLLACGEPGVQLTWMDAKVGDRVITPRIGKPVEVQALWINALWIGSQFNRSWSEPARRASDAFVRRFWNPEAGCLYDVIDCDHQPGKVDPSFRPNQIFAVGGLPIQALSGGPARQIVDAVQQRLLTPLGLRSLAPDEPVYQPKYQGGVWERDSAYHQGTVWPWLLGPFVEGWVRVRGNTNRAKREARQHFLAPLAQHLGEAGLGHISEVADGDAPHRPGGCPFQAWSLAEYLRLTRLVLTESVEQAA
jgi:predicted glycogen debranching enzyme